MEKQLFAGEGATEEAIRLLLEDTCDKTEQLNYLKDLNDDDLEIERELFSETAIKIATKEAELADTKAEYNAELKPLKSSYSRSLNIIESRTKPVLEKVYVLLDHDAGMVGTYNHRGELVAERLMQPQERQLTLMKEKVTQTEEMVLDMESEMQTESMTPEEND